MFIQAHGINTAHESHVVNTSQFTFITHLGKTNNIECSLYIVKQQAMTL